MLLTYKTDTDGITKGDLREYHNTMVVVQI